MGLPVHGFFVCRQNCKYNAYLYAYGARMPYFHEYHLIKDHYGDRVAERSGVPLMQHIDEGLLILNYLGAADYIKGAFCLHPLIQNPNDYIQNIDALATNDRVGISAFQSALAYRKHANAYLCKPETDDWTQTEIAAFVGPLLEDVRFMLIADKVQNKKDFMLYHHGSHARSDQLLRYFDQWMEYLDFDYEVGKEIIYAG